MYRGLNLEVNKGKSLHEMEAEPSASARTFLRPLNITFN